MPDVEVIIPFRGGCRHRERALEQLVDRYPWPVTVAEGPDPWIKAAAVMPAIAATGAELVIVADADVWCDELGPAVAAVAAGAAWAIPHKGVHRLTELGTAAYLAGAPWYEQPLDRRPYRGVGGGGYVISRRDALLLVPLDGRFVGWGQEDESWGFALETLLGPPTRLKAPLIHLWHPPQPRRSTVQGSASNWALRQRYAGAHGDKQSMARIAQEARDALEPSQPRVHGQAAHG